MNWYFLGLNPFQVVVAPLCALLALRALVRTWRKRIPRRIGIVAFAIWSAASVSVAFPRIAMDSAQFVGISRGADLVMQLAILAGVGVCFYFYQRSRQLENLVTELIRREAIRDARFGSRLGEGEPRDASTSG
jgi:small membrane protein